MLRIGRNSIDDTVCASDGGGDRSLVADVRRHRCDLSPVRGSMEDGSIRMTHRYADGHAFPSETLYDGAAQEARSPKDSHQFHIAVPIPRPAVSLPTGKAPRQDKTPFGAEAKIAGQAMSTSDL